MCAGSHAHEISVSCAFRCERTVTTTSSSRSPCSPGSVCSATLPEIGHAVRGDGLVADRVDVVAHEDAAANVDVAPPVRLDRPRSTSCDRCGPWTLSAGRRIDVHEHELREVAVVVVAVLSRFARRSTAGSRAASSAPSTGTPCDRRAPRTSPTVLRLDRQRCLQRRVREVARRRTARSACASCVRAVDTDREQLAVRDRVEVRREAGHLQLADDARVRAVRQVDREQRIDESNVTR